MRWFLRAVGLLILLVAATAIFAPGWIHGARDQLSDTSREDAATLAEIDPSGNQAELLESDLADEAEEDLQEGIYLSPLFGGLAKLGGQISETTGQADLDVNSPLAAADRELARTKRQNRMALREVSRPYRRVSPRSPHLLLITVSGLGWEDVAQRYSVDSDSTLARMHQDGLRFIQYYTRRERDQAWRELHSALIEPDPTHRRQSVVDEIWKSGYLTALIGDCTQSPAFQGVDDRHYDHRFGIEEPELRDRAKIDQVWSNGQQLELVPEADGQQLETQDLFLNEAASFIATHRHGRPFFLHLTFDVTVENGRERSASMAQLDRRLEGLLSYLRAKSLEHETVIILAGLGIERGDSPSVAPAAQRAPLLMYWPDRKIGKSTDVLCATMDLMPTIAEWTQAPRLPATDGMSLKPNTLKQRYDPGRVLVWPATSRSENTVVAQSPWELILANPPRLFDSKNDPGQSENLAGELRSLSETLSSYAGVQL